MKAGVVSVLALSVLAGCATNQQPIVEPVAVVPAEPEPVVDVTPSYIQTVRYNDESPLDQIQIGRYTTAESVVTDSQFDLLNVMVDTTIPSSYTTVGQAIKFLLLRSGYSLYSPAKQSPEAQHLLMLQLPQAHRNIGPVTLKKALLMIAGEAYTMQIDPVKRFISFSSEG